MQFGQRVAAMAKEWFRQAEVIDRLKGRGLAPVREELKPLSFRKDTSSGAARKRKKKR